ncbi:MAG: hypothetical protein V4612_04620 [Pseudomonadota bacterium]
MKLPKFYHKKESKFVMLTRHLSGRFLFWSAFLFFSVMFLAMIRKNDIKIPQRDVTVKVNIKDKINICLPDERNNK